MKYLSPRLRRGSEYTLGQDTIQFRYLQTEVTISLDDSVARPKLELILERLLSGGGIAFEDSDTSDAAQALVGLLDQEFLICDDYEPACHARSGLDFLNEIEGLYFHEWAREKGQTRLTAGLAAGSLSKDVVIGWTFEYYHVTRRSHFAIAPILVQTFGSLNARLQQFFREEYRHDKLLLKSLTELGFTKESVMNSVPLPFTNALMTLFERLARTDTISFICCLFLFEGTDSANDAYIESLRQFDLPRGFVDAQASHNEINKAEGHANFSRELIAMVPLVSDIERARALRNIRLLFEMMILLNDECVNYYTNPRFGLPRSERKLVNLHSFSVA